jgi:MurNAc alpha-1-phosphate uridylyltransferase
VSNLDTPVVILAGGLATRLRPVTETVPKSMLMVKGEPFIFHQLRQLKRQGLQNIVLCVGYLGELIEAVVGDGAAFGLSVQYAYDGDTLLGTAGSIKQALPLLGDAFFILYGDSYLNCDYAAIHAAFQNSGKQGLMTVFHNEGQWDTSNVEFSEGALIAYSKKNLNQRMHYIDYGLGLLKACAFDGIALGQVADLASIYEQLLSKNELIGFEVKHRFYEIGSFAGIEELEYHLAAV